MLVGWVFSPCTTGKVTLGNTDIYEGGSIPTPFHTLAWVPISFKFKVVCQIFLWTILNWLQLPLWLWFPSLFLALRHFLGLKFGMALNLIFGNGLSVISVSLYRVPSVCHYGTKFWIYLNKRWKLDVWKPPKYFLVDKGEKADKICFSCCWIFPKLKLHQEKNQNHMLS